MSEQLLEAVIRLFALLARLDGVDKKERSKMQNLLASRLNQEMIGTYMDMFDRYCNFDAVSGTNAMAEISYISRQINGELTQQQKIFLISELTQLIYADNVLSEKEAAALLTISKELRIDEKELKSIRNFVVAERIEEFDIHQILFVGNHLEGIPEENSMVPEGEFHGFLAILHLQSIKPFFLRYFGNSTIFLNQIPLESGKVEIIPSGAAIRSDRCKAMYYSDLLSHFHSHKVETPITFKAENIRYTFKNGNIGLQDISISETNGSLVGVMGASGSGKSTLFNVLNGNMRPDTGQVCINGINIHKEKSRLRGLIGYVPQDDLLIEELSVQQNLYYAAKLCFEDLTDQEIQELVERTLVSLGLHEIKNLKVGNALQNIISGGQRKRLNIGLELLREPMVLFVDEPTSGLSSRDSENIMDLLKELSLRGKLVFVVIHQPSSDIFKMFDKLFILDKGGYPIYYGNPMEAVAYFREATRLVDKQTGSCHVCGNVNAEQIFNIIEARVVDEYGRHTEQRKITPATWNQVYKEKLEVDEVPIITEEPQEVLHIPGRIKQLGIFIARDFRAKLANRQYVLINLIEAPLLAIFLAALVRYFPIDGQSTYSFQDNVNIPAYIFIGIIVALFMGLTVSAEEIIKDKKILKRESLLHLSRGSYLVSKLVLLFGISAVQTATFVIIGNMILGIHGMYFSYWLVFFSASCFANVLGLNISASFNSAITIYILIPLLLIPQILLSGVVVKFDQLNPAFGSMTNVPLIGDLMASRWAHEALMVHQFKNNKYEKLFYDMDREIAMSDYKTAYYLPKVESLLEYSFTNGNSTNEEIQQRVSHHLSVARHEIVSEIHELGTNDLPWIDNVNSGQLDSVTFENAQNYLTTVKRLYVNRNTEAENAKNTLIKEMTASPKKAQAFQQLKKKHTNDKVTSIVYDKSEKTMVLEHDGELVQKVYPIFSDPKPTGFFDFRAMFYQPHKHFAGKYFDTLFFNVWIIWCMSLILVVALYFDLLRKCLAMMGRIRV